MLACLSGLLLCACAESRPPTPASFVDRVWQVRESNAVEAGMRYVFLGDGTLVMSSPNGRPALGTWSGDRSALTMVEDGISYRVEVLNLSESEFRIRSHNPGQAVDITLVPPARSPAR